MMLSRQLVKQHSQSPQQQMQQQMRALKQQRTRQTAPQLL